MALLILKQQMGEEEAGRRSREMIVQVAVILVIRFCRYSAGAPPEKLTSDPVIYS
jgi:hypothetical protein